jgi:hypothetical protein
MKLKFTRLKLVLLILTLIAAFPSFAQEDTAAAPSRKLHPELHIGVTAGGHLYNGRFIYRTGKALQFGITRPVWERIYVGISGGVEKYESELFLPLTLNFTGMLGSRKSAAYLTSQVGYAAGINKKVYSYANYDYDGGWMFSAGSGYRFAIGEKYAILLSGGYKHQFAKITYAAFDRKYTEPDNFNLIYFRIGFQL